MTQRNKSKSEEIFDYMKFLLIILIYLCLVFIVGEAFEGQKTKAERKFSVEELENGVSRTIRTTTMATTGKEKQFLKINENKKNFKHRLADYRRQYGIKGMFKQAIANNDREAILYLFKALAQKKWEQYSEVCMAKFRSKQLCFSNNVSFYIWQRLEIEKMREQILGKIWKIHQNNWNFSYHNFIKSK